MAVVAGIGQADLPPSPACAVQRRRRRVRRAAADAEGCASASRAPRRPRGVWPGRSALLPAKAPLRRLKRWSLRRSRRADGRRDKW